MRRRQGGSTECPMPIGMSVSEVSAERVDEAGSDGSTRARLCIVRLLVNNNVGSEPGTWCV